MKDMLEDLNTDRFRPLPNSEDHYCFACGPSNPSGLHMQFFTDENCVLSRLTIRDDLCGWDHVVHGGIISTVLDETMSWTAIYLLKKIVLTKSITVDFIKPVYAGTLLTAKGQVHAVKSERQATMQAELCNEAGQICAKSTGTFALLTPKIARKLQVVDDHALKTFTLISGVPV